MPADKDVTPRKIGANAAAAAAALCPAGHRGRPKALIMVHLCFHWESEEREGGGGRKCGAFHLRRRQREIGTPTVLYVLKRTPNETRRHSETADRSLKSVRQHTRLPEYSDPSALIIVKRQ